MSARTYLPLAGIALCAFVFNVSEFMPVALLTDIGEDLGVSESTSGLLISVYAWFVAGLSLPLMLAFRNAPYRPLFLGTVAVFITFQVLSAVSPGYWCLMGSRIGVACAHAIFWSIATPLAVRVVPKGRAALAMSVVATATSVATVVGLPMGRIVGLELGWRATFEVVALISAAVLVLLMAVFPKVASDGSFSLSELPGLFGNRVLVCVYAVLVLLVLGYYTGYSYVEPFLDQVAGLGEGEITVMLALFGASGIIGSVLFNKTYHGHPRAFLGVAVFALAASLLVLRAAADAMPSVALDLAVWGIAVTGMNLCLQVEVMRCAPGSASTIAMSLYSGLFNVGIASGSLVGGFVVDGPGIASIGYVGAVSAFAGALLATLVLVPMLLRRGGKSASEDATR